MTSIARRLALIALIAAAPAGAQGLKGTPIGLPHPAATVDFGVYAPGTGAMSQFASYGVTFSRGLTLNNWSYFGGTGGGLGALDNFTGGQCCTGPFSIYFNRVIQGAAFQAITNQNTATTSFTAVLNGTDIFTYAVNTGGAGAVTPMFYGFDASLAFNEIRILPEQQVNGAIVIDNLEIGQNAPSITATPEPATMVLVATGLLGVFGVARRRRTRVEG